MADLFDLTGKVAVVTGGYGVLGGSMAHALAAGGARVAILGRNRDAADAMAQSLRDTGAEAIAVIADVTDEAALAQARARVLETWQRLDILVNAAGGNVARSRSDTTSIFDVPYESFDEVLRLNLHGTVLPSLVFGAAMAEHRRGCIVNISSMASTQALSGVMGYSAAKAAVDNFTRWFAVDLARHYGDGIRVNAIAPGFFISTQNRAVLVHEDGSWTPRAQTIVSKTPMGRFGRHDELHGALRYLCSDAASFVTGTVLPVDGGFSAFSGV
jgi:NAD(P)-dependent dehydrogenase (short-subunit alcohol dehydrogenase family)